MKTVTVINNTNILNLPEYHKESNNKDHKDLLEKYCILIGLDYTNYRIVQECLLNYGAIIITTFNKDYALTWLPKEISIEQCKRLYELEEFYKQFQDLEFLDFSQNGLGKHSNEKNNALQVLEDFYVSLKKYEEDHYVR